MRESWSPRDRLHNLSVSQNANCLWWRWSRRDSAPICFAISWTPHCFDDILSHLLLVWSLVACLFFCTRKEGGKKHLPNLGTYPILRFNDFRDINLLRNCSNLDRDNSLVVHLCRNERKTQAANSLNSKPIAKRHLGLAHRAICINGELPSIVRSWASRSEMRFLFQPPRLLSHVEYRCTPQE